MLVGTGEEKDKESQSIISVFRFEQKRKPTMATPASCKPKKKSTSYKEGIAARPPMGHPARGGV